MNKLRFRENSTPGLLFTFCGLDGSGKTTLINRLVDELGADYPLFLTKQPTPAVRESAIFRTYMDSPDHSAFDYRSLSLLAASDRVQHVSKVIEPRLQQGMIVISDRYFYSCLANLRARGYGDDQWIYEIAGCMIRPNLAFFVDTSVGSAVARVRARKEEKDRYIDLALQYRLRAEYQEICRLNGGIAVSSAMPLEDTYRIVKKQVRKEIERWKTEKKSGTF